MYKPKSDIIGLPDDFNFGFSLTFKNGEIILLWAKSKQERNIWMMHL
jgi:hypothetical protein